MWRLVKKICRKSLHSSSRGTTLVEVVIAVVVLGLITSSVPPVLILLNNQQFKWNEQTVAESLVRTQIEYIKGCPYIPGNASVPNPEYTTVPVPSDGYQIVVEAVPLKILDLEEVTGEHLGRASHGNGDDVFTTEQTIVEVDSVYCGGQVLSEGSSGYEIELGQVVIKDDDLEGDVSIDYWYRPHVPVNFADSEQDQGLQEITVSVYHVGKLVLSAKNYKVDR